MLWVVAGGDGDQSATRAALGGAGVRGRASGGVKQSSSSHLVWPAAASAHFVCVSFWSHGDDDGDC